MFDVSSRQTFFDELQRLYDRILVAKNTDKVPIVIVGNKCDLPEEQRQITPIEGKVLARAWNCRYIEASARTRQNDVLCFYEIVRQIRELSPKQEEKGEDRKACCVIV